MQKKFQAVFADFGGVVLVVLVLLVTWVLILSQKLKISLFVKFQPSSTHPSDRFW